MNYAVQIVREDELPQGVHMVIVEQIAGPPLMLINGPHARAWRFMRAYEDTREPCTVPSVLVPARPLRIAV
jgi:hypothetical protein